MTRRSLILVLAMAALAFAGFTGGWLLRGRSPGTGDAAAVRAAGSSRSRAAEAAIRYYCPMHPSMTSDRPDDCPICHMRMVPIDEERAAVPGAPGTGAASTDGTGRSAEHSAPGGKRRLYRSTMNPNEVSDHPGKDSMGMEMVPVDVDGEAQPEGGGVAGLATVRLSLQKRQLIGVGTSPAVRAPFRRTIRAVGRVARDETREAHVTTKIAEYVERLHANAVGVAVRKGEPILEIFSPELLASQQEYLLALRSRDRTASSTLPSVASAGDELVASARRRLELLDLSEEQIQRLEATGRPERRVVLHAPVSGVVTQRLVAQGDRVEAGAHLLDVTDLSVVWVLANVYEYELPFVRAGQRATVSLSYDPGRTFSGRVGFVYPMLEAATRTAQVRVELPNPDAALKPDMYADVALEADLGVRLSVPETAVLDTGDRTVVFVDAGDGFFEPRQVRVGLRSSEASEILEGLAEGERVLVSGNFFVDSESRIKSAFAGTTGFSSAAPKPPVAPSSTAPTPSGAP